MVRRARQRDRRCRGCIDLVRMRCMLWPPGGGDGRAFDTLDIGGAGAQGWTRDARAVVTREIVAQAVRMRQTLCFSVADAAAAAAAGDGDDDGGVGDACISSDGNLSPALLLSSLRRSCTARTCVPGPPPGITRTSARSRRSLARSGSRRCSAQHRRAAPARCRRRLPAAASILHHQAPFGILSAPLFSRNAGVCVQNRFRRENGTGANVCEGVQWRACPEASIVREQQQQQ